IVHRDLKPRNLFLTGRNDGRALVKVLDFGISKHKTAADLSLTRTTEIIGSPNYMSPEQLKSARGADERSDIWALGVILYELLTGQVPFVAESVTQLTAMVLMEKPRPVDQLRSDVPHALASVIERCLEKEPERRFGSVAELAGALGPFAPADSRDLAVRIARIAGGSKLPHALASSSGARIAVAGGTSVNWSGRTELAPVRGKRIALVALIAMLMGVLAVVAVFAVRWRSAPARPVAARTAAGIAPEVPTAPSATPSAASSASSAALPPLETPSASVSASASARPGWLGRPGPGAPGAPTSSGAEPPRYRTSW
ncbi:MAG TPA: serine/threonine-protein kinase, partial [Polyangiaceae bacterium]